MSEKNIFFKKGVLFYKEVNKALSEILDVVAQKSKKKKYNIDDFQTDFNYITQYFLFNLAIPNDENKYFSFSELLYIVDIGNLNSRLDFAISGKDQTQQVFLVISEKTSNEIKKFNKEMHDFIVKLRRIILKIFKQFDGIQKKKNAAYDKIIIFLANVIESFLNLEEKNGDNNLILDIVKKTKKFFFNI